MDEKNIYAGLEPAQVWRHFAALNAIPRPSGHEEQACQYAIAVASAAGAPARVDAGGNVVIELPASAPEFAAAPAVAIQAHLDMVCEKRPDVRIDFERDPIIPRREGDLIYASGTTLGADNGIGAALALALLTEPGLSHGPLELIFTVEEETGLYGAMRLDTTLVTSRMLINLDSEDPDELTIGCAGGSGSTLSLALDLLPCVPGSLGRSIVVSGLAGGHSGVQIHEPLANAIKLLSTALERARDEGGVEYQLAEVTGGSAHNAIPRDASALLAVLPEALPHLERAVNIVRAELAVMWREHEPGFDLTLREAHLPEAVMEQGRRDKVIELLNDLPHGVLKMSTVFEGKVETSSNLAEVHTQGGAVHIATSTRSFRASEIARVQAEIRVLGEAAGAAIEVRDGYPGWQPDPDSRLLKVAEPVYFELFKKAALVKVVHAGLECGVIVDKMPGMDAISFGPLIRGAHTPEEYVEITSVASSWRFLTSFLEALAKR